MFNFDNLGRIAFAAICSLVLTTVAVGATIAPIESGTAAAAAYASQATESGNG